MTEPMTEGEAKYKALLAGVRDSELIDNAERIVEIAIAASWSGGGSFETIFWSMMWAIVGQRKVFGPLFKEPLSPDEALLTLRNTLWKLLEQWDDSTGESGRRLGSECMALADRLVDAVSLWKGWREVSVDG